MEYLGYYNHLGEYITFQKATGWYIQNASNLFSFTNEYELSNYSRKIKGLNKNIEERTVDLVATASSGSLLAEKFNQFFRFIEKDIAASEKGRLVTSLGFYLPCFIKAYNGNSVETQKDWNAYDKVILPLKIVTDEPYWFLDVIRRGTQLDEVDFIDDDIQGTSYPMDMIIEISGATTNHAGITFTDPDGVANLFHYGVNFELQSGQKLTINTKTKEIYLEENGVKTNVYDNREAGNHSIFAQLPAKNWQIQSTDINKIDVTFITRKETVYWI